MPNVFAYFILFSWPVIVAILFRIFDRPRAIVISVLGGYLFLPLVAGFDLPLLPTFDKALIPALSAITMCLLIKDGSPQAAGYRQKLPPSPDYSAGGRAILIILLLTLGFGIFGSVLVNQEALIFGPAYLRPMRIYDAFSIAMDTLVMLLPFYLGWRYLSTKADHQQVLGLLAVAGLIYSLPTLFEVRMSPQLNIWFYGFFPHAFDQHIRGSGFRPIVFLQHGLMVGIFFSMATLAGAAMLRSQKLAASNTLIWSLSLLWLLMTLVFVKSLGALIITVLLLPLVLFGTSRWIMRAAAVIALIVLTYPMLRALDWVPVNEVTSIAQEIDAERASSFDTRVRNEDILLDRAQEKPWFGWGGWARNRVYDPVTGVDLVIVDGQWIIFIGYYGWLGYIARFGILTFPLLLLMARGRKRSIPLVTSGLALVMAANLIDLIPNSALTPVTWLIGGSLAGYVTNKRRAVDPEINDSLAAIDAQRPIPPKHIRKSRA